MNTINHRIKLLRESLDKTQDEFAEIINVSQSTISYVERSSKAKFAFEIVEKIKKKFPSLSLEWLVSGYGNMWKEGVNMQKTQQKINFQNFSNMDFSEDEMEELENYKILQLKNSFLNEKVQLLTEQLDLLKKPIPQP